MTTENQTLNDNAGASSAPQADTGDLVNTVDNIPPTDGGTDPEGAKIVGPFFQQHPTPLTILLDHYQVTVKKYGVGEIPSLFLIDPEGIIVHKEVGYREDLYQLISSFLKP